MVMPNFLSVAFPQAHHQLCRGDCHKAMHVLIIVCLDGRQIGHDSLKQTGTYISFASCHMLKPVKIVLCRYSNFVERKLKFCMYKFDWPSLRSYR